jgi:hypothetical protein
MDIFGSNNNSTTQPLVTNTGFGSPSTTLTPTPTPGSDCTKQYVKKNSAGVLETCTPPSSISNLYGLLGGRKRRHSMKRGGSFRPSTDLGVASTASPFSGGRTAQPHNWTGGKRRRRSSKRRTRRFKCNKCSKRRRHKH